MVTYLLLGWLLGSGIETGRSECMTKEYEREITVMGSVPSLGPVILFDDVEGTYKWGDWGTGGDFVNEKQGVIVYNGSNAGHVKSRTTGAAENDQQEARRAIFQRPGKRYAAECLWIPDAAVQADLFRFGLLFYDGSVLHEVHVAYSASGNYWLYMSLGGTEQLIPGSSQTLQQNVWQRVRFEVDQEKGFLTRLVSGALDLTGLELPYQRSASAGALQAVVKVGLRAGSAPPGEIYFDDVLVMEI